MFKEKISFETASSSAMSVTGLVASVWLLAGVWYTNHPTIFGWKPYEREYVVLLVAVFVLSLLGTWKNLKKLPK
jgi:Ca2+/H+ antiporter